MARKSSKHQTCTDCPARDHGFCGRLPEPLRTRFREVVHRAAPEQLSNENERGPVGWDLAVVSRGTLSSRSNFEDGGRAITDFLVPGEVLHASEIGERGGRELSASPDFLLCLVPSLESAFAPADCRWLERYIRSDAVEHIEALRDRIAALTRLDPTGRIAHLLLGLRERLNPEGQMIALPFSRSDIADLLGMRAETVSRSLLALEQAELIHRDGPKRIEILDSCGLASLAGG